MNAAARWAVIGGMCVGAFGVGAVLGVTALYLFGFGYIL
jgi:hypothetical protein